MGDLPTPDQSPSQTDSCPGGNDSVTQGREALAYLAVGETVLGWLQLAERRPDPLGWQKKKSRRFLVFVSFCRYCLYPSLEGAGHGREASCSSPSRQTDRQKQLCPPPGTADTSTVSREVLFRDRILQRREQRHGWSAWVTLGSKWRSLMDGALYGFQQQPD